MKILTPVNNRNLQMCDLYQLYCKQIKRELFFVSVITITVKKFITFTVLWLWGK